jgi:hypothetical protein
MCQLYSHKNVPVFNICVGLVGWFILWPTISWPVYLGIWLPFGAHDQISSFPFFWQLLHCSPVGHPLWWEDGSVTCSEIAVWSGHWGPITIHYRFIWDCVPFSSPLKIRRDYGGGILTRLHTGNLRVGTFHKALLLQVPVFERPAI